MTRTHGRLPLWPLSCFRGLPTPPEVPVTRRAAEAAEAFASPPLPMPGPHFVHSGVSNDARVGRDSGDLGGGCASEKPTRAFPAAAHKPVSQSSNPVASHPCTSASLRRKQDNFRYRVRAGVCQSVPRLPYCQPKPRPSFPAPPLYPAPPLSGSIGRAVLTASTF